MSSTKFVIMDPWLSSVSGHFYEYDKSIIDEFKRRGIPVDIFAAENINPDIKESLGAVPFFHLLTKNSTSLSPHKLKSIIREYKTFFDKTSPESVVFAPNILSGKQLLIIAITMLFISPNKYKKLVLLLRYIPDGANQKYFYKLAACLLKNKVIANKIIYTSDSELVARDCYNIFYQGVYVLPIPHVYEYTNKSIAEKKELIKLFLPGEVRIDKGIFTILKAVELLISQNLFNAFELTVQYNPASSYKRHAEIGEYLYMLKEKVRIRILSSLSTDEYSFEFQAADIILAPYIAKNANGQLGYHSRTSGVFSEAVAAGKPVITTKDTWMAHQLEKFGSGICITEDNYKELAEAFLKMSSSINEYKKKAENAVVGWMSFHNSISFCDKLIAISN